MRRDATTRRGDSARAMATDARARATRAVYLRETVISKLRLARTLSDTAVYKSYARRSALAMKYTLTIYEQRKMLFLAVAHAMATMVVWSHFFLVKYRATAKVPRGANLYWWKRLTPPFEFGAMHAILFQMALLPLTMARQSVAALSTTSRAASSWSRRQRPRPLRRLDAPGRRPCPLRRSPLRSPRRSRAR